MHEVTVIPSFKGIELGPFVGGLEVEDGKLHAKFFCRSVVLFDQIRFVDAAGDVLFDTANYMDIDTTHYTAADVMHLVLPPSVDQVVLASRLAGLPDYTDPWAS